VWENSSLHRPEKWSVNWFIPACVKSTEDNKAKGASRHEKNAELAGVACALKVIGQKTLNIVCRVRLFA
jgi:hypothetical protein